MEEYEALGLAGEAGEAAGRLNRLMDDGKSEYLAVGTREYLADRLSGAISALGGCIAMLGDGPGADPAMGPALSMAAQQIWDAVRGLDRSLIQPRPWPGRGDPVTLMRAHLAVQGWNAGARDALATLVPYQTGAASREDYLSRIVRGDAAGKVLAGIGLGKWAGDPSAEVAVTAYCESYAAAAGLELPGPKQLASIRYLPGQQVTDLWSTTYVLDGGAAPGGSPLAQGPEGPQALFHRAAIRAPLVLEFTSEEAARTAMQAVAVWGRTGPIADGDVLAVPGSGTWLACGTAMIPAASFPDASGRYADSIRLARTAVPEVIHVKPSSEMKAYIAELGDRTTRLGFPGAGPQTGAGRAVGASQRRPAVRGETPQSGKPPTA